MHSYCEQCRALAGLLTELTVSTRLYNVMVAAIIIAASVVTVSCIVDIFRRGRIPPKSDS
ncbi:MAG: hypothetical protein FWC70_05535 [Defluviitaleaceae bacterium]|nr:hypothetical protein [Defluviitaleaceae bacterium]